MIKFQIDTMNKIIALRGRGGSGKSSTIKYLYNILINTKGFKQIKGKSPKEKGDFVAVLSKGSILIGLTSLGDTYSLVYDKLKFLVDNKCLICVSACRTFDKKQPGTSAAIESFKSYEYEYIEKKSMMMNILRSRLMKRMQKESWMQ